MKQSGLRLALAQLNLLVGDVSGNTDRIVAAIIEARDRLGADLVAMPELSVTAYPPEDLLLRPQLLTQVENALDTIAAASRDITTVVGHPLREHGCLYNAVSVIRDGAISHQYRKQRLPNYRVFDEKRYFHAGTEPVTVFTLRETRIALSICEDIWQPGIGQQAAEAGADLILNVNASPYHRKKSEQRAEAIKETCEEGGLPLAYVNLVGGQDELVFDGNSLVTNRHGNPVARMPMFRSTVESFEFSRQHGFASKPMPSLTDTDSLEAIYQALMLGIGDYVSKSGFAGAVLGLSGGIDSALTCALAVDALGAANVSAILMPSEFTADMSIEDARAQADTMGVQHETIAINEPVASVERALSNRFSGKQRGLAEENIQARIRGLLLMAVSNKFGALVLATGNKSEMAVGYSTLYGDMAGGFAPLKDVPKTLVYELAQWRNTPDPVIPKRVLTRPPSAELKPDQTDQDSLPAYEILDPILERYIEADAAPEVIISEGFDAETVMKVVRMVDRNEYKRRQAAPGVRISQRAFGRDRRMPIVSGYREY